ncbi:DUF3658 domain-containing protein [Clostridium sp. Cult2]
MTLLLKNLPGVLFIIVRFIGNLLCEYNLDIIYSWYAWRIDKMIKDKN